MELSAMGSLVLVAENSSTSQMHVRTVGKFGNRSIWRGNVESLTPKETVQ